MSKDKNKHPEVPVNPVSTKTPRVFNLNLGAFFEGNMNYILILLVLVLVVYFTSLGNGFVSDDKGITVDGSKFLTSKWIFEDPLGFLGRAFLAAQYSLAGTDPMIYRLVNVLFHLGNTLMFFIILTLLSRQKVAFFAAALFAVHPILTEDVTWISGGNYVVGTFFFLVTLLFYMLSYSKPNLYWVALAIFIAGLFYSNRLMTLFPILIVFEFVFGNLRKNWPKLIPFVLLGLGWGIYYYYFGPINDVGKRVSQVASSANLTSYVYNPFFYLPFSLSWYFELIFFPNRLSFYHSNIQVTAGEMVLRYGVLFTYIGALVWSFIKNRALFFWLAFFVLSLLLFLTPFPIAWIVADRYAYMATFGILAAVGFGLAYLLKYKEAKIWVYIFFAILVLALGIRTIVRNNDWKDEDSLMISTLRTDPENAKVHDAVGLYYVKNRDFNKAIVEFQEAIKLDDGLTDPLIHLGDVYQSMGQADKATPLYQKAQQLTPR